MNLLELMQKARAGIEPGDKATQSYANGRKDELDYWIEFIQKNNENLQVS